MSGIASNVSINLAPLTIQAPMKLVWENILKVEDYSAYNPFHRKVEILHHPATGHSFVQMWVNLFHAEANKLLPPETYYTVVTERIMYVDEREDCCILLYGAEGLTPTIRGQVVKRVNDTSCVYYSYHHFAGSVAGRLVFWALQSRMQQGFHLAAQALKNHCESQVAMHSHM